jgi:hypothetical protein
MWGAAVTDDRHVLNVDDEMDGLRQFTSRVRAQIADGDADEAGVPAAAMDLWNAVYGTVRVSGRTVDEVREGAGRLIRRREAAATVVAVHLAFRLADLAGVSPGEVLDEAERDIERMLRRAQDGDVAE